MIDYKKIKKRILFNCKNWIPAQFPAIKGIVSDSKNNFIWYELKDINKNVLFPKFQLIPNLGLQAMHDNVHWWLYEKVALFHTEMISAQFLWGNMLLRGELQYRADIFESALYMKSGSMPLIYFNIPTWYEKHLFNYAYNCLFLYMYTVYAVSIIFLHFITCLNFLACQNIPDQMMLQKGIILDFI